MLIEVQLQSVRVNSQPYLQKTSRAAAAPSRRRQQSIIEFRGVKENQENIWRGLGWKQQKPGSVAGV